MADQENANPVEGEGVDIEPSAVQAVESAEQVVAPDENMEQAGDAASKEEQVADESPVIEKTDEKPERVGDRVIENENQSNVEPAAVSNPAVETNEVQQDDSAVQPEATAGDDKQKEAVEKAENEEKSNNPATVDDNQQQEVQQAETEVPAATSADEEPAIETDTAQKNDEVEAQKADEPEAEKAEEVEVTKPEVKEQMKDEQKEAEKVEETEVQQKAEEGDSEKVEESVEAGKDVDKEVAKAEEGEVENGEDAEAKIQEAVPQAEEAAEVSKTEAVKEPAQQEVEEQEQQNSGGDETAAQDDQQEPTQGEEHEDMVQVETDVKQGPPGSPKIAMEEKKTPRVNLEATATVKFVLMPSGQVVTLACTLGQSLDSLKSHFSSELKMSSSLIMIMFDGKSMPDTTTLADLGVGPNGTVQLEMQSADPVNTPLKMYRPRQEYHMPDVITVRVMTEDGEAKDVVVEIERSRFKKPFLGGFRNKNSGTEFHNAAAQTMKKPRPPPTVERFCRDTQTCEQKNLRQQTTNTTSTQMTGVGVYISNIEDKLMTPGKYFSADDHWAMVLRNVIILQKYYRRWLAKRYVTQLKEDKAKRLEWERKEELRKKREKEERIKRDYARRLNPKTKADFDMLLHCLEKWRQEEMERINSTLSGAERKAALCMLLDQETELLSAIERHKNEANKDNRDNRIIAFLEKAAAPKKWQGHDGNLTFMDTPFTIRAKELRDIYNSINMKYLTQDERLDVLLTLKHTVKEHDCKLTQEIIELIDREADLLMRGTKEGNLTGLRKRISTLFLQYIKTPTFNPEAARLLKVPQDPSTLRKNINYCHSCGRYLPSTDFFLTSNSKQVGRCRNCMKVENDGRQREDYTFYRVMLKSLRKSEEAMQDGSSICYLLQENDLRYLVENIWSNQSVLSAWDDLYDLVLVRWDKHQEWSPWNCILLTHDEAEAHQKLFSLEEGYGHVFIHKVTQKHNFARNYFSRLPGMSELLRQKVGNRELINNNTGPSVSGHTVQKAQKV